MHTITLYVAAIWITLLLVACAVQVVKSESILTRVLAFDTMALLFAGLLALVAGATGTPYYLDAAVGVALISFAGTVAAARYAAKRGMFS